MTDREVITKFDKKSLLGINKAVKIGHALGLTHIYDTNFLQLNSARPFWQNIINSAVDLIIEQYCNLGLINYNYRYDFNKQKNCQHLELINDNGMIITHSSGNYNSFPKQAIFREQLCNAQMSLFDNNTYEMYYAIVMHSTDFQINSEPKVCFGIPNSKCKQWSTYLDLASIQDTITSLPKIVEIDEEKFEFELKEKIKKVESR